MRHATSNCSTYLLKSLSAVLLWSPSTFQTRNDREQVLFSESAASLFTVLPVLSLSDFLVLFHCSFLCVWLLFTHSPNTCFLVPCGAWECACVCVCYRCVCVCRWNDAAMPSRRILGGLAAAPWPSLALESACVTPSIASLLLLAVSGALRIWWCSVYCLLPATTGRVVSPVWWSSAAVGCRWTLHYW